MDDYGAAVLPPLLATFAATYPSIRLHAETGLTGPMSERLGERFDVVVAMHSQGHTDGILLRRDQAVWATSPDHEVERRDPLPLALYPQGCLFRQWATESLDRDQRAWRIAFVSHSLATVEAVVAQGLAVTVVKARTCPGTLRRLGETDGMPSLPAVEIRLHRAPDLSHAGSLLVDHLVAALREPAEPSPFL
jgi:DNA-binding transcriptional LysR family regulator